MRVVSFRQRLVNVLVVCMCDFISISSFVDFADVTFSYRLLYSSYCFFFQISVLSFCLSIMPFMFPLCQSVLLSNTISKTRLSLKA